MPVKTREDEDMSKAIWVKTMPTIKGDGYVVTLESDDDTARVLTPDEAMAHAGGVLAAVARAEYDAAVMHQLTSMLSVKMEVAGQIVADLRADRPPLDTEVTAPIWLDPGVNKKLVPFLVISVNGKKVGQWTMEDARGHALFVVMAVAAADLDAAYARRLTGTLGLDKSRAGQIIDDLGNHRDHSA